jgi:type I restriction enzyme S subunit
VSRTASEKERTRGVPLPSRWTWETFGAVAEYHNGRTFSKSEWSDKGRPIIRIQNLTGTSSHYNRFVGSIDERQVVQDGDLLISWSATLGAYIYRGEEGVLNQHIFRVVPGPDMDRRFLYYATLAFVDRLRSQAHGSGMQHITSKRLKSTPLPVPPLDEQRRIVARLEELLSQIDMAVKTVRDTLVLVQLYRQSALEAALRGVLTAEWRQKHDTSCANTLLQSIQDQWGVESPRLRGIRRKTAIDQDVPPPSLPKAWAWSTLGAIADIQGGVTVNNRRRPLNPRELPYLRVANVQRGYLDLSEVKTITVSEEHAARFRLQPGDILLTEGGDRDKLGRGWVWRGEIDECIHQNHVFRARPRLPGISSEFVSLYTNVYGQQYFSRMGRQTTNLASINKTNLSAFPIPLPPLEEQHRIASLASECSRWADSLSKGLGAEVTRSSKLRLSILERAFCGQL